MYDVKQGNRLVLGDTCIDKPLLKHAVLHKRGLPRLHRLNVETYNLLCEMYVWDQWTVIDGVIVKVRPHIHGVLIIGKWRYYV